MHDIEPWWGWRDEYTAESDPKSPFYGREYDEFTFTNKVYNYYIHPQWDDFGSETLYGKVLYVNYKKHFALIELIGEWNDSLENDIMFLKRNVADALIDKNISRFVIFCDNVLNYHGDEDCYYEEWYDDVKDDEGYICFVNTFEHVLSEMKKYRLYNYVHFGNEVNEMNWRALKPEFVIESVENKIFNKQKQLL